MRKALLFINGVPPKQLPDFNGYDIVACTDGAYQYLLNFNNDILSQLTFVSGDFDSHPLDGNNDKKFVETPDQNKTDFQKALEIILDIGIAKVDVYGGSGGEMDHFLGNISVADFMKDKMEIQFYDEFSTYYFIAKNFQISNVKDRIISLFPFPYAEKITTSGLKWPLHKESLLMGKRIGTRNLAEDDEVTINYEKGNLLIFISS